MRDPKDPKRFLTLKELVDAGYVHEVWFTGAADNIVSWLECVEIKPRYDASFRRIPGEYVQAGNGGDPEQRFIGRSLRLNMLNYERGVGCGMENLGHALEGTAHSNCIPYFREYFYEYAMFDLDTRFGLPFNSYYYLWGEDKGVEYPDERTAIVRDGDKRWTLNDYYATGGMCISRPTAGATMTRRTPSPCCRPSRTGASAAGEAAQTSSARGRTPCWSRSATSRPTAWDAGWSTGGRTCRATATKAATSRASR